VNSYLILPFFLGDCSLQQQQVEEGADERQDGQELLVRQELRRQEGQGADRQ